MKAPVYIVQDNDDPVQPWSVKDRSTGETVGRARDESGAADLALQYAYDTESAGPAGEPFVAVLCVEGVDTGDGRYLEPGTGSWRTLPQPLMAQTTIPEMGGHAGAVLAGRIDTIRMDGRRMMAEGVFDAGPEGGEAARLVDTQMLRFVSIDMSDADVVSEPVDYDEDGFPTEILNRFGPYEIMGATATPHPAIKQAVIWLKRNPAPEELYQMLPEPLGPPAPMPDILLADGSEPPTLALIASGQVKPPAAWFADPQLPELTPVTVTDEGRVFGHIASWDGCHIGFLNRCVEPPHGDDYAKFLVGEVVTAEGSRVPTGVLTAVGGHADVNLSPEAAKMHYDDVSSACADVTIGEDRYGPWIAGAVRPGVTEEQIRVMRGSAPSGDWRPFRGKLELVHIHYVNTPGFPVPRLRARVASGELVGLTASIGTSSGIIGDPAPEPVAPEPEPLVEDDTRHRLAVLERAIEPLLPAARDSILAGHETPPEPSPLERYLASRA